MVRSFVCVYERICVYYLTITLVILVKVEFSESTFEGLVTRIFDYVEETLKMLPQPPRLSSKD